MLIPESSVVQNPGIREIIEASIVMLNFRESYIDNHALAETQHQRSHEFGAPLFIFIGRLLSNGMMALHSNNSDEMSHFESVFKVI